VTGLDMLFEQLPAYLEFFGFPAATAAELRATANIKN
jgi:shikimate dehydrogenase